MADDATSLVCAKSFIAMGHCDDAGGDEVYDDKVAGWQSWPHVPRGGAVTLFLRTFPGATALEPCMEVRVGGGNQSNRSADSTPRQSAKTPG